MARTAASLIGFVEELRTEGVAIGTAELLDAFSALDQVSWTNGSDFREALAATVAKSQEDRRIFDLLFDRHFFREAESEALEREGDDHRHPGTGSVDAEALKASIREALRQGSDGEMGDLARLALAAFGGGGERSGVVGVDVQRIRRELDLGGAAGGERLDPNAVAAFEKALRAELERGAIQRTGKLPPARALADLDRTLPGSPSRDLAAVHRAVTQMKRRLATLQQEQRGHARAQVVDVRKTMRASLETGGVPMRLRYRSKRPRRPEIYVCCDVSTSVSSASVFFLSVLHALHDSFRRLRSFVFIERICEVTEVFEHERDFRKVSERIAKEGGVADISGYTDYGRVWLEFEEQIAADLGPRSTVIVLGDARANGRDPHADAFGRIAEQAGRTFWLNPEPRLYWNYGDSVMRTYEERCDGAFECWTTRQLEDFVKLVSSGARSVV